MNTKEYIESGILEQYVMGTVSAQEKQEVECMSHIYPEIATELLSVQHAMEAFAISMKVQAPAHLREKILGALSALPQTEAAVNSIETNKNTNEKLAELPTQTNQLNEGTKQFNLMRMAAAILFLLSVGLGYLFYNSKQTLQSQQKQLVSIQQDLQSKEDFISLQTKHLQVIQNTAFKPVLLAGIKEKSPDSKATIYWNKETKEVYISIGQLPVPSEDKQYQLWAIADGKPVDMGMLNARNVDSLFQQMKSVGNAQAFAITLEKKGGVPSPTLTEMYVMGGV